MNWILDFLLLAFIILCAWIGRKQGFIKTFFGFFGSLISFLLASLLSRPIGDFIGRAILAPPMKSYFSQALLHRLEDSADRLFADGGNETALSFLERFRVGKDELVSFAERLQLRGEDFIDALADSVIDPIALSIGQVFAYLLLFLLLFFVLRFLVRVLDLIAKLPILNFSNQTMGLFIGLGMGLVFALFFSTLIDLCTPFFAHSENWFLRGIDPQKTYLIRFFSQLNLLM